MPGSCPGPGPVAGRRPHRQGGAAGASRFSERAERWVDTNGSGRVVVVTGASGGIGRATAVAFARRGDKVALLARGEVGLAGAADDVRAAGGTPLVVPVDVADPAAVEAAAERVE